MESKERFRAERAMDLRVAEAADQPSPQRLQWPSVADRIRQARLHAGLGETEVAQSLNMTVDSYWDLEHHDDEAFAVASLRDLTALGRLLKVEPRVLLLGPEAERAMQTITFNDISVRLADRIAKNGVTVDQFGDAIGWDVRPLSTDPQVLWSYDVETLYNISKALGLDWVAALPSLSVA